MISRRLFLTSLGVSPLVSCPSFAQANRDPSLLSVSVVVLEPSDQSLSTLIQEALTLGNTIYLSEGDYILDEPIILPSNSCLLGAGDQTRLLLSDSTSGKGAFSLVEVSGISVSDLVIDGSGSRNVTHDGIFINHAENIDIKNVHFNSIPNRGLNVWGSSKQINIVRCRINNSRDSGCVLGGAEEVLVNRFFISNSGKYGIWILKDSRYIELSQNIVHSNSRDGIFIKDQSKL